MLGASPLLPPPTPVIKTAVEHKLSYIHGPALLLLVCVYAARIDRLLNENARALIGGKKGQRCEKNRAPPLNPLKNTFDQSGPPEIPLTPNLDAAPDARRDCVAWGAKVYTNITSKSFIQFAPPLSSFIHHTRYTCTSTLCLDAINNRTRRGLKDTHNNPRSLTSLTRSCMVARSVPRSLMYKLLLHFPTVDVPSLTGP